MAEVVEGAELRVTRGNVEQVTIRSPRLDPIRVVLEDFAGSGQGMMTVTCYGRAWTAYWGGMGEPGVMRFVLSCDVPYLVGCLVRGMTPTAKRYQASDEAYLSRIVEAIQQGFRSMTEEASHA